MPCCVQGSLFIKALLSWGCIKLQDGDINEAPSRSEKGSLLTSKHRGMDLFRLEPTDSEVPVLSLQLATPATGHRPHPSHPAQKC